MAQNNKVSVLHVPRDDAWSFTKKVGIWPNLHYSLIYKDNSIKYLEKRGVPVYTCPDLPRSPLCIYRIAVYFCLYVCNCAWYALVFYGWMHTL